MPKVERSVSSSTKAVFSQQTKAELQREIDVLKKLNHPQVPTVFGAYTQQVNGRDLLHVVQSLSMDKTCKCGYESNTLSMSETRQILADTLGVLEHLHSATPPILHRDIKPSNLMRRLDGRIVLIDFGQAVQDVHRTLGQTMVTGTIGYQAPEQISGNATVKSDVYSVGVVAVELLTGTSAFTMLEGQTFGGRDTVVVCRCPFKSGSMVCCTQNPVSDGMLQRLCSDCSNSGLFSWNPSTGTSHVSNNVGSVSTDFLNMLDGAIQDESESSDSIEKPSIDRRLRRREVLSNGVCKKKSASRKRQLWQEMLGSWEQLLSAIQAKKVSQHKGLELFRSAFEPRVQQCFDESSIG